MKNIKLVFLLCFFFIFFQYKSSAQTKVVLKLDDIGAQKNESKVIPVLDYLMQKQIKVSLGVIAKHLDETALPVLGKYLKATNNKKEKLIEIWHHGLDHSSKNPPADNQEFKGTSYAFQKEHFEQADKAVLKYLGVQMVSFGAPFNAVDSSTLKVIAENPKYKAVMFTDLKTTDRKLTYLNNRVDMEKGTGKPDYDHFITRFESHKSKHKNYLNSFIVLQGHPNNWTKEQFTAFKNIIDYLIAQKCEFVLPAELIEK